MNIPEFELLRLPSGLILNGNRIVYVTSPRTRYGRPECDVGMGYETGDMTITGEDVAAIRRWAEALATNLLPCDECAVDDSARCGQ